VIRRRANYELTKAEKRDHIVRGLITAQGSLDRVVKAIRAAKDGAEATEQLQAQFKLSDKQAGFPFVKYLRTEEQQIS